ncbi:MAG TPA: type II toxin-antitoxin system HicB family antitoxin [Phycisphaerae bacterium]|nr:type II toxin-antitoxin system HicB family antitoxin [Phycisphaerae bacterium]HNU46496.1 type II toxin-antitoxin system HicB family antitoxin [Phycisphaerae bacterium]
MKYTVIIRAGNESGYVATVPALPGCVSQGRTRRQTLCNAKEAIEAYIEALLEDGLGVPVQTDAELVDVEVSAR